jgi:hypothetical protein
LPRCGSADQADARANFSIRFTHETWALMLKRKAPSAPFYHPTRA